MMAWDNPEDYEYTKSHELKDWAWEFIRRNPDYRGEWKYLIDNTKFSHKASETTYAYFVVKNYIFITEKTPQQIDFVIPSFFRNRWYLECFHSPEKVQIPSTDFLNAPPYFLNNTDQNHPIQSFGQFMDIETYLRNGEIPSCSLLALFDLKAPIKSQLEAIEKQLQLYQKNISDLGVKIKKKGSVKVTPKNKQTWLLYLRLLDAEEAKIRVNYSAPIIFKGTAINDNMSSAYKEYKKQAKAMLQCGYMNLLQSFGG